MSRSILALTALTACFSSIVFAEKPTGPEAAQQAAVIESANSFAADLFARVGQSKGNLFLSPWSIHLALDMTSAGGKGRTAEQMAKVLRHPADAATFHKSCAAAIKQINAGGKQDGVELFDLSVANSIWAQKGYPFNKQFIDLVRDSYLAELVEADFANGPDPARKAINGWVEKATKEKIKDLVPEGMLTPLTRLVLVNAIYFKSEWTWKFKAERTSPAVFHLSGDKAADVPMMHQMHSFAYAETDTAQLVDLPYRNGRLVMTVILPKQADGLGAVEKAFDPGKLAVTMKAAQYQKVDLSLPKFRIASSFDLTAMLQAMGMTDAFGRKADFSGIATAEELYIQAVLHKAYVDVNEDGTEAAAATAIPVAAKNGAPPSKPVVFNADHPFLFAIRHVETGAVLFVGRMADPR